MPEQLNDIPDFVRGDLTCCLMPAHPAALVSAGAAYLTQAFHAFGSLPKDNHVTRIVRVEPCSGGSTGQKLFLTVEYARADPGLHKQLFVKFSRDFGDPVRDARGKHELAGEVQFATASRAAGFPITVPVAYFADYEAATHTGMLITERIAFGEGSIEPHRAKCTDQDLPNPIEYYRTIIRALAQVAGAHRAGRLSEDLSTRLPLDRSAMVSSCTIAYSEEQLLERIARFDAFVQRAPQLFPANITPALFADIARHAGMFIARQADIRAFLASKPDLIAMCHWNANIDNAWFWRNERGDLRCGLMDWGHVSQLNLAFSLWGCLSGACLEVWNDHFDELIELFTRELAINGGPRIAPDVLTLHFDLYVAMMGLSYFIDSPARIVERFPAVLHASGPWDPIFRTNDTARNQLHIATAFLNLWQRHRLGERLNALSTR